MDEFQFPEDLTALDADGLAAAEQAALDEFDRLRGLGDDLTEEQVAMMERLAEHVAAIRAEGAGRESAAEDRRARAEAAAAALADPTDEEGEEGDAGDGATAEEEQEQEGEEQAPEQRQPEAVAAAGSRRRAPSLVRRTPQPEQPRPRSNSGMSLVASADVSGYAPGQRMEDLRDLARAFAGRASSLPTHRIGGEDGVQMRYPVATIQRDPSYFGGLSDDDADYGEDYLSLIAAAAREDRLDGGSLVAAGGWCAPSETLYDLCENRASLDGLWDVPEIGVTRGGIRFTRGPDFTGIYETAGFIQTEAQAIAGTTKPCIEVTCPAFVEERLDAVGLCVKAPILTNAAYPELVRAWIEGTLIAQQHRVSGNLLTRAQAAVGAAVALGPAGTSVAHDTLTGLELVAEGFRQRERMPLNASMEVVLPTWARTAIRSDLAFRTGQQEQAVTDEQIRAHFAARNLRVQFVYNYQPLTLSGGGVATDFPSTVEALIYPAGTFVKGTADVLSLDTMYDSTDLASNVYTAAFVEEGVLLARTCGTGTRVTLNVCVSGRTGAADVATCWTTP